MTLAIILMCIAAALLIVDVVIRRDDPAPEVDHREQRRRDHRAALADWDRDYQRALPSRPRTPCQRTDCDTVTTYSLGGLTRTDHIH